MFIAAAKTLAIDIEAKGHTAIVIDHLPKAMDLCQASSYRRVLIMGAYESESNTVTEQRGCMSPFIQPRTEFLFSLTD